MSAYTHPHMDKYIHSYIHTNTESCAFTSTRQNGPESHDKNSTTMRYTNVIFMQEVINTAVYEKE